MQQAKSFFIDLLKNHESRAGRFFGGFLITMIIASVAIFILETVPELAHHGELFHMIDSSIMLFFGAEYALRIAIANNKRKFILSPLGLVDLIVILPLFVNIFDITFINLIFLRGFRILEILRIMKVIRYSDLMRTFLTSFRHYREELRIFFLTFTLIWVFASFGFYTIEHADNPAIENISQAFWWALVTMSTVGYGDMIPVTTAGRVLAGFIIILGLGTIAIMTAILTKIFMDHFFGKRIHNCDFCHFPHHDHDSKFCKNCGSPLDIQKLLIADIMHPHFGVKK